MQKAELEMAGAEACALGSQAPGHVPMSPCPCGSVVLSSVLASPVPPPTSGWVGGSRVSGGPVLFPKLLTNKEHLK